MTEYKKYVKEEKKKIKNIIKKFNNFYKNIKIKKVEKNEFNKNIFKCEINGLVYFNEYEIEFIKKIKINIHNVSIEDDCIINKPKRIVFLLFLINEYYLTKELRSKNIFNVSYKKEEGLLYNLENGKFIINKKTFFLKQIRKKCQMNSSINLNLNIKKLEKLKNLENEEKNNFINEIIYSKKDFVILKPNYETFRKELRWLFNNVKDFIFIRNITKIKEGNLDKDIFSLIETIEIEDLIKNKLQSKILIFKNHNFLFEITDEGLKKEEIVKMKIENKYYKGILTYSNFYSFENNEIKKYKINETELLPKETKIFFNDYSTMKTFSNYTNMILTKEIISNFFYSKFKIENYEFKEKDIKLIFIDEKIFMVRKDFYLINKINIKNNKQMYKTLKNNLKELELESDSTFLELSI